jgi:hypothetical protein
MRRTLRRALNGVFPPFWRLKFAERALHKSWPLPHPLWARIRKAVLDKHGTMPRAMWIGARISDVLGDEETARTLRVDRLLKLLPEQEKANDLDQIISLIGEIENFGRTVPFSVGRRVAQLLGAPDGRAKLLASVKKARKRHKRSVFLLHLETLIVATEGGYRQAATDLVTEMRRLAEQPQSPEQALRMTSLQNAWRVVDQIARNQMDWAMEDDSSSAQPEVPGTSEPGSDPEAAVADQDSEADVSFEERALQTRRREEYLAMCHTRFSQALTLEAKIKAVQDMLRTGVRHIPHYGTSYAMANDCLDLLESEIGEILDSRDTPDLVQLEAVCGALKAALRLGRTELVTEIQDWLVSLASRPEIGCLAWQAAEALSYDAMTRSAADTIMALQGTLAPSHARDVKNFLNWAMRSHKHDEAHAFVRRLPSKLRRTNGMLHYASILQRESRFEDALDLVRKVHAQSLTNPLRANPVTNASLLRRAGELEFLCETAKLHAQVPQPIQPKGLILVMARNIDQLRRVPLVALTEFKRRGWAVIPLVEGLLPIEPTGKPEIDQLIGAVTPHTWLSPEAERVMPDLKGYNLDAASGRLTWAEIDLSHPLWEDAAINRRRHSIDWTCPELQNYLGGLADWTRSFGRVLEQARKVAGRNKLRVGTISLFSHRLPDALPRFYCESRGNKDRFFHLHAANGYQNYFTNFSTNISHRFVLRNMTRHPEARSASFPLPENFETYYARRRPDAPALLAAHSSITKVKRSTAGQEGPNPDAIEARRKILNWKANGGKVACAFGKVVFDSSVPFDGGHCHRDMKDWINHCIRSVQGSKTLLLIKPHPHELNNQIATFPTEYFSDLIEEPLGKNAMFLGHRWFDMHDMRDLIDLGVIYNGTTTIELGIMGIPAILSGHFAAVDYPIGQNVPMRREEYEACLRFEKPVEVPADLPHRAAVWLDYMANEAFTQPYRFHARPVTNKVLYPPYWFKDDLRAHAKGAITSVQVLVDRALGVAKEPVSAPRLAPQAKPAAKKPAPRKPKSGSADQAGLKLPKAVPAQRTLAQGT